MADMKNINILNAISTFGDYHTSVILTYGANLAFYEQGVLSRIWQADCRNNLIFMDANRYHETISEAGNTLGYIGRRYLVAPIKVGNLQAFHSKIILLLGSDRARLLIGSGNLTFNGYGDNLELFTQFDWSSDTRNDQGVFSDIWKFIIDLQKRWGHFEQASAMLDKAERQSGWLYEDTQDSEYQVISSLDAPLLEQLVRHVGNQKIERITILSPFLDSKAKAIENLYRAFNPKKIDLVLQNNKTCGDVKSLKRIQASGVPINFYNFEEEDRYVHAKLYVFEKKNETILAIGSANCTQAGLLAGSSNGNLETLVIHKDSTREKPTELFSRFVSSQQIDLSDSVILRPKISIDKGEKTPVDFQEFVLEGQTFGLKFYIHSLPSKLNQLALRFFPQTNLVIPIENYSTGVNNIKLSITDREAQLLGNGICSAAIYRLDIKTSKYMSLSDSLWLTNIGELSRRQIFLTLNDERAGHLLSEMHLGSDEDWRDLYNTITTLIEFEIEKVESIRLEALAERVGTPKKESEKNERESILRVIDIQQNEAGFEINPDEDKSIKESTLSSWLKIVFSQFPGEKQDESDFPQQPTSDKPLRHKPNLTIGGRFNKLVRRYIRSLKNSDFTQNTPPHHLISYFSVFHKIVWLLYRHRAIDKSKLDEFVMEIHAGFFGNFTDTVVPFGATELRNHLKWIYSQLWKDNLAYLYALSSLIATEDRSLEHKEQYIQALTCIFAFVSPQEILVDQVGITQVANSYNMTQEFLSRKLSRIINELLPDALDRLETWSTTTVLMLKDLENDELRVQQAALICIGIASERITEYLKDKEQQISYCADLVYWTSRLNNSTLSSYYQEKLVELHKEKGDLRSAAHTLLAKGNEYRSNGDHRQAVKYLLQAKSLAKELNDKSLLKTIDTFLSVARFLA